HEIIEEADLTSLGRNGNGRATPAELDALVHRKLAAFGLETAASHRGGPAYDPHVEVVALLKRLASSPVPIAGCSLADLDPERTLREWNFVLPVEAITPVAMANIIAEFGPDTIRTPYSLRVRDLRPEAIGGFLTGIADYAFEHRGRWFVLDWKSTHLGSNRDDYAREALGRAAQERHYLLQLMIYTLGLHRYLRTRIIDYDFDRHIGGAGIVFLRGVDGVTDRGFYLLTPRRELIEAMDSMLSPVAA
ncbi:MAG: hypothetical protein ACOCTG_00710, partial [Bacteroidota bacterium]